MIDLQTAIQIATEAHKNQWRKPQFATPNAITMDAIKDLGNGVYIIKTGHKLFREKGIWFIQEPYITHPLAVMEMMDTEEEKIVAVLHDVIEDCDGYGLGRRADNSYFYLKADYTREIEISLNIYSALMLLTKDGSEKSYESYIKEITSSKLATKVKIADMFHNMSTTLSEKQKEKYLKLLPILLKEI